MRALAAAARILRAAAINHPLDGAAVGNQSALSSRWRSTMRMRLRRATRGGVGPMPMRSWQKPSGDTQNRNQDHAVCTGALTLAYARRCVKYMILTMRRVVMLRHGADDAAPTA